MSATMTKMQLSVSSIDLTDPHITMAYDALANNDPLRWFLLSYSNKPNQLSLCASGMGDLEELCSHLIPGQVQYAMFREHDQDKTYHVALSYIPNAVGGVKRARALVHAKAVSTRFKAHQTMSVSNLEQITVPALRSTLRLPPRDSPHTTDSLPDQKAPFTISRKPPPAIRASMFTSPNAADIATAPASAPPTPSSSNQPSQHSAHQTPPLTSGDSVPDTTSNTPSTISHESPRSPSNATTSNPTSSNILPPSTPQSPRSVIPDAISRHTNVTQPPKSPESPSQPSWLAKQGSPLPQLPSQDLQSLQETQRSEPEPETDNRGRQPDSPLMESIPDSQSIISYRSSGPPSSPPTPPKHQSPHPTHSPERKADPPIEGLPGPSLSSPLSLSPILSRTAAQQEAVDWRSKRAAQPVQVETPVEKQSTSSDFQTRGADEEERAPTMPPSKRIVQDSPEPRRTSSTALHKTPSGHRTRGSSRTGVDEGEEHRLSLLQEEGQRRAIIRAKKEKQEREEEEARELEFKERKEREKARRLEIARKAEERRQEQQRDQEEAQKRQQETKRRQEEENQRRRDQIQKQFNKKKGVGVDLLSGFITLESSGNWKRRYFRLSTEDWVFFKHDTEPSHPVQTIDLSQVRALREWHEGYDELEAIPNSFAVEFDNAHPRLFFTDSAEEKEVLLGLLAQAAGL